jgi:ketosteroid isomerase-like protein
MNDNETLIQRFYEAFNKLDYKTMQECYHDDAVFFDPVFQDLNAYEVRNMWEMLCRQAKNFSLTYSEVKADEAYGTCRWTARYTFSRSGRRVVNKIRAHFRFRDGRIIEHTDDFDLWTWSRQALGLTGWVLGWSEMVQKKIRNTAQDSLLAFLNAKTAGKST